MNGCLNRPPYAESTLMQNGWSESGTRRMVEVPFRMETKCAYQKDDRYADPKCVGCKHKEPTG